MVIDKKIEVFGDTLIVCQTGEIVALALVHFQR